MAKNHYTNMSADEDYIMNLALGYQVSQILFAAINLNIFTVLDSGAKDISEIAKEVESNEGSLKRLANALVALNLLEKKDGMYFNAKIASRYLVKGRKNYLGNTIHQCSNLWDFWEGLDKQIKSGRWKGPDEEYLQDFPHRLKDYLAAMSDFANLKANSLADAISIGKYRNMLDIGCGPGTYAIAFAERNPKLYSTIVDLELNLAYIKPFMNKSKYRDRIRVLACNILEGEIPGGGYDLIFISNLIHIYGETEVKKIMEKVWCATATPGSMVIHDYILNKSGDKPLFTSLFDLNMFVGTPNGKCYTILEIKELLKNLGAKNVKQIPIGIGSSLVIGEKQ